MTRRPVIVCGVRPQFIKVAALLFELRSHGLNNVVSSTVIFDTNQHYDPALRQELHDYGVAEIRTSTRTIPWQFGPSVDQLHRLLSEGNIASVIVFGDATPGLVGAIAASRLDIPLVHIEAGARRDRFEVEDANSRMIDAIAAIGACVTRSHLSNLNSEGFKGKAIRTGDLAERYFNHMIEAQAPSEAISAIVPGFTLVTLHRPMNSNIDTIESVAEALAYCGERSVWVEHPRNAQLLRAALPHGAIIVAPQSHRDIAELMLRSRCLVTDSGGLIREAHVLQRRCFVPQTSGGWPELIEIGHAVRCENMADISSAFATFLSEVAKPYPDARPLHQDEGATNLINLLIQEKSL